MKEYCDVQKYLFFTPQNKYPLSMWISFKFGKKFNPVIFSNHPIPTFRGVLLGGSETIRIAPIPVGFVISLRLQELGVLLSFYYSAFYSGSWNSEVAEVSGQTRLKYQGVHKRKSYPTRHAD